jgi:hypothetical protein
MITPVLVLVALHCRRPPPLRIHPPPRCRSIGRPETAKSAAEAVHIEMQLISGLVATAVGQQPYAGRRWIAAWRPRAREWEGEREAALIISPNRNRREPVLTQQKVGLRPEAGCCYSNLRCERTTSVAAERRRRIPDKVFTKQRASPRQRYTVLDNRKSPQMRAVNV